MKRFYYNSPILVGDTWFNLDGTTEKAKFEEYYPVAKYNASDYAAAVKLNREIMGTLLGLAAVAAALYMILL